MKKLYLINKASLIITLVLYLTLYLGLYAQIVLGALQVISALIIFLFWKKFSKKTKKQLYIYWSIVIIYGLFWLIEWHITNNAFFIIIGIIVIPMFIAIYFVVILKSIKNYIS